MNLARTPLSAALSAVLMTTVLLLAGAEPADGELRQIRIIRVTDGDTLTAIPRTGDDKENAAAPVTIRLYGVDAPETDQPGGTQATEFVMSWLEGRTVVLREYDRDWYGRIIGEVFSKSPEERRSLNEALVYRGWAWWYREYAPRDDTLAALEAAARGATRGLWAAATPTPPWEWR